MDIKIGQKIRSTHTGREYEVKKILQDNSVILHSKNGNASALINKDQLLLPTTFLGLTVFVQLEVGYAMSGSCLSAIEALVPDP